MEDDINVLVTLARVETKLDTLLALSSDHETRIRALEDRQASPLRVYAIPISMLSAVCTVIMAAVILSSR